MAYNIPQLLMISLNNQFHMLSLLCLNNYPVAFLHSLDIEFIFFTYS